ncbi:MAG: hypothetical protein HY279_02565 [Nitrospinae bacterium]|nr:hypothetical protein [Candidatus Staskawiczbacteria bacterium]MBI3813335.1 hypothetical protein [Nitrospinota bacterium]
MKAEILIHDKVKDKHGGIIEVKVWLIPKTIDKPHGYKYSLVYIKHDKRILGYDNAEGKGDHRHYGDRENQYNFISIKKLFEDFYTDLKEVNKQ